MIRLITTISILIASLISDNDKSTREYIVFETNVHDSLNIGIYGAGHVQRFKDSLSQNMSLMVSLHKEEQYSGLYMALKTPLNLSKTTDTYLSFRIKGAQGRENIYVYFKDTDKEDGDIDLQTGIKISDFDTITGEWKEVHIPLDSFPVEERIGLGIKNLLLEILLSPESLTGLKLIPLHFSKPDSADYTFFLDDIKIVAKKNSED